MNAMNLVSLALNADGSVNSYETVLFWIVGPLMVFGALGLVFFKKAVYAAISVVFVMVGFAFLYLAQDAMFLGIVQIVVYTGAIMMIFLFVIMLIGIDSSESLLETVKGQRAMAVLFGAGVLLGLGGIVLSARGMVPIGLDAVNVDSNPVGVARLLFSDYAFAMQITGALLIIAAVSAITLTSAARLYPKVTQRDVADAKMKSWAKSGTRIAQLPAPGVYARSNAADVPALSASGTAVVDSVPRVLRIRGQQRTIGEVAPDVLERRDGATGQSGLPGMPGLPPPDLEQSTGTSAQITEGKDT